MLYFNIKYNFQSKIFTKRYFYELNKNENLKLALNVSKLKAIMNKAKWKLYKEKKMKSIVSKQPK